MISILINYHNEPIKLIKRLLKTIENQLLISKNDFKVYLYSDGENNIITQEFLKSFSFPIFYKILQHKGVCATRNSLFNDSNSEYVMFCDADDYFHSQMGLYWMIKAINDTHADIIGSPYEAEILQNNKIILQQVKKDPCHVHGKIFKRQYLIDKRIYFPDEIPYSGDAYFLWLAYNLNPKCIWILDSFYVWSYNPNSITRKNENYQYKVCPISLRNYDLILNFLKAHNQINLRNILVSTVVFQIYFKITNEQYMAQAGENKNLILDSCNNFLKKYKDLYFSVPNQLKEKVLYFKIKEKKKNINDYNLSIINKWLIESI